MKKESFLIALFVAVTAAIFYLFYQIVIPFFVPICWAAVFSILFYPLYERLLTRIKRKGITSAIVCFLIVVLIIAPLAYLFVALVNEAVMAVGKINEMYKSGKLQELLDVNIPLLNTMSEKLADYFDLSKVDFSELAKDAVNKVSGTVVSQTTWLIANFTKAIFYFALMVFTMYYFFKEGETIICKLKRLVPMTVQQVNITFSQLRDIIQATMYGGLAIALLQGIMGGIMFWAVGIPSPVFWGAIMAFLSIVPLVGAFLVYVPAGLLLIISGSYVKGLMVILIGSIVISQVDNVIRPFLIAGKTAMHPLLLFFCILGGIYVFGMLGIVLGPMIGAVFMALVDIMDMSLHPEDGESSAMS